MDGWDGYGIWDLGDGDGMGWVGGWVDGWMGGYAGVVIAI